MTEYGVLVKNTAGGIQIDSIYSNYTLFEKAFAHQTGTGISTAGLTMRSSVFDPPPLIAFKPYDAVSMLGLLGLVIDNDEWYELSFFQWNVSTPAEFYFRYAVFTVDATNPIPDYGFKVLNASGDLVYHSGDEPLTILDVHIGSLSLGWYTSYTDVTVNDADNYFMIIPSSFGWVTPGPPETPGDSWIMGRGLQRINGTTVRVVCVPLFYGGNVSRNDDSTWYSSFKLIELKVL